MHFYTWVLRASFCLVCCTLITSATAQNRQTDSSLVIKSIQIIGNKTTKDFVIYRELSVKIGDTLSGQASLQKAMKFSRNNLVNTLLFNFITINPLLEGSSVKVFVTVAERWYTWPIPIFEVDEPNFNLWLESRDLSRASFGMYIAQENFRGRRESIRAKVEFGYRNEYGIQYEIPYLNKKQTIGLKNTVVYSARKEAIYRASNNVRNFYRADENHPVISRVDANSTLWLRSKYFFRTEFSAQYSYLEISDSLLAYNQNYLSESGARVRQNITLGARLRYNKTDYINYPLKGHYWEIGVKQRGLGIFGESDYMFMVGGWFRKFLKLQNRLYYSTSIKTQFSFPRSSPYVWQPNLANKNYVRGFEYYVIDNQHFGLVKNQLRFAVIPQQDITVDLIPIEKFKRIPYAFYLGVFNDLGYAYYQQTTPNPKANTWLSGTGVSLDFVTYYDRILRLEYTFNNFGESGIFIHFTTPI